MKEGKIRFNIIFVSDEIPRDAKIEELKDWGERFQKNGLTPEIEGNYTGNLSFRSEEGFIIRIPASQISKKRKFIRFLHWRKNIHAHRGN